MKLREVTAQAGLSMMQVHNWIKRGEFPFSLQNRGTGRATEIRDSDALQAAKYMVLADAVGPKRALEIFKDGFQGTAFVKGRVRVNLSFPELEEQCDADESV